MRSYKPLAALLLLLNLLSVSVAAWSLHADAGEAVPQCFSPDRLLPLLLLLLTLGLTATRLIKRRLLSLRNDAEKFRLFLSQASDGIYILNEYGQVIEASDSFCQMLGRSKDDLLGRHVSGWMREWQAGDVSGAVLPGYLSLKQAATFESVQLRADGERRAIEASAIGFSMHGRRHLFVCVREIEQRKRWEQMRSQLSAIVAASEDALISCDGEGRVTSWNPAAETLFGFSEEEASGQAVETLLGLSTPAVLAQKIRQAIWGESVLRHESSVRNRLGEEQSATFTIAPLRGAERRVVGVSLCIRNVTEQKAVETLLHLQSTALKASDDAILIAAVDGKVVWANPAYSRLSGYARNEVIGYRYHDLGHWENEEPEFYAALMRALHEGRIWRGETSSRRSDGSEYYEEQSITPFHDSNGKVSYFIAVKRDVSERRQAELALEAQQQHLEAEVRNRTQALEESRQKIQLILDSSAAGLYGIDEAGRLLFINRSGAGLLGHEASALLGRSLDDCGLLPAQALGAAHPLASGTGRDFAGETLLRRADGHCFPARCESRPLVLDGREIGTVVSFTDISAQREADLAREAARAEAERLARAKGEFLANMSHEIRTPLNGILGAAQVGERQSENLPAMHKQFRRIIDSGRLLLGIINDILDLTKIEAGKMQIEQLQVSMLPLVQSTVAMIAESAQAKGLALTVDCDPALETPFLGDPLRLSQIILNLLANAVKFTERGGVRLGLRHDGELEIRIADTGIGMSPEQVGRIFTAFEQADGSTTRRYGGTGLGLSITRSLVDLMGGRIRVDSQVGHGTEFIVRLPAPFIAPGQQLQATRPFAASGSGRQRLAGMRVLVADDNEVNRLVIEEMLLVEGAEVSLVSDGHEAVAAVRAAPTGFDLILMDVQMPGLDGCAATRAIVDIAEAPPVIAQTAHALVEERQRYLDAGMRDQISKPIDQEELVKLLLRHARPLAPPARAQATETAHRPEREEGKEVAAGENRHGSELIDWPALQRRYASKPHFILRLLRAGRGTQAEAIANLSRALAGTGERQAIGRIAHSLKGSAGTLLAAKVAELARQTEHCAERDDPGLHAQAEALLAAITQLHAEIEERLQDDKSPEPPAATPAK